MLDDGDAAALIVTVHTDDHGDHALRAGEGLLHHIALTTVRLVDIVNRGKRGLVKRDLSIAVCREHHSKSLNGLLVVDLPDAVLGQFIDHAQNTGNDCTDQEQDQRESQDLIHFAASFAAAFAAFLAAFSAAMSSLDTPN